MAATFDPYGISPDFAAQGGDVVRAWQNAIAKLNYQKNNVLQKYGFNNEGDISVGSEGDVTYNPDGTVANVKAAGGLTGVTKFSDLASKDNKTGYGGFRDELNAERSALDAADNAQSRGFTGGLSNQAKSAAQEAVNRSQFGFSQDYNQFAGGFNQQGTQSTIDANTNIGGILRNQAEYKSQEAAWQASIPAPYTAGVSGGGSTPINQPAVNMAASLGYGVNISQLGKQGPVTFKGTAPAPARGGHATTIQQK